MNARNQPKKRLGIVATLLASLAALLFTDSFVEVEASVGTRANRFEGRDYLPGVVIVKYHNDLHRDRAGKAMMPSALEESFATFGITTMEPIAPELQRPSKADAADLTRIYRLTFDAQAFDAADAGAVAAHLASFDEVEYAEPQFVYQIDAIPNDPSYAGSQSGYLSQMQFPAAWDLTKGEDGNVVVAIVDGGTDWDHPDLLANLWSNADEIPANGIDDDNNGFIDDIRGWNFANNSNDPTGLPATPSSANHGTHVAGIACAVTNNSIGVAGASWNSRFMPICTSSPTTDLAIAFGYNGVIYAAQNDADVINMSWGGGGGPSAFEQDVLRFARESGSVLVAAAGNSSLDEAHWPSSYPEVLSVANVNNSDIKSASSTFHETVDVSAQGSSIFSTGNNAGYNTLSGTSMASPHAAAVAAIVKTNWPAYSVDQVAQRVRVTSDNIDALNPAFAGKMGYGRVNAHAALTLTTPAIRVSGVSFTTSDGDNIVEPDETISFSIEVTNYLDAATDASFTLSVNSPHALVTSGNDNVASMGTLESVVLATMEVSVLATAPINHVLPFTLDIATTSPSYTDLDRFEVIVLPVFANHNANSIETSVTSVGKLGFGISAGGTGEDGAGFRFRGSENFLFEGAMLMGTSNLIISDAARGPDGITQEDDFVTEPDGNPSITEPEPPYAEHGVAVFNDDAATLPMGLTIVQDSYEVLNSPYDDFIILEYTITNDGLTALSNFYAGWYFDWDIDGGNFVTNRTGYDATRGLGYAYDDGNGPDEYIGVIVLTPPGVASYRGIWNDESHPDNPSWGVYDGYTDDEKWECLSGGITQTDAGPADISQTIATGPFDIGMGESIKIAFAILGGTDLVDLQINSDAARSFYADPTDTEDFALPPAVRLEQNFPNPFNPNTRISFDLPRHSPVSLRIYRPDGRLVRTLVDGSRAAGRHRVIWDGRDDRGQALASGTYFYQLKFDGQSHARKMQLLR